MSLSGSDHGAERGDLGDSEGVSFVVVELSQDIEYVRTPSPSYPTDMTEEELLQAPTPTYDEEVDIEPFSPAEVTTNNEIVDEQDVSTDQVEAADDSLIGATQELSLSDDSILPEDGESTVSANGDTLQVDDSTHPEDGASTLPEGGDSTLQVDDSTLPEDGDTLQVDDSTLQVDDSTLPVDDSIIQVDDSTLPVDDSTLQVDDSTLQVDDSTLPEGGDSTMRDGHSTLPVDDSTMRDGDSTVSADGDSTMRDGDSTVSADCDSTLQLDGESIRLRIDEATQRMIDQATEQVENTEEGQIRTKKHKKKRKKKNKKVDESKKKRRKKSATADEQVPDTIQMVVTTPDPVALVIPTISVPSSPATSHASSVPDLTSLERKRFLLSDSSDDSDSDDSESDKETAAETSSWDLKRFKRITQSEVPKGMHTIKKIIDYQKNAKGNISRCRVVWSNPAKNEPKTKWIPASWIYDIGQWKEHFTMIDEFKRSRCVTLNGFLRSEAGQKFKVLFKPLSDDGDTNSCGYNACGVALELLGAPNPVTPTKIAEFRDAGTKRRSGQDISKGVKWPALRAFIKHLEVIDIPTIDNNLFLGQGIGVQALKNLRLGDGIYMIGGYSPAQVGHVFIAEITWGGQSVTIHEKDAIEDVGWLDKWLSNICFVRKVVLKV